MLGKQSDATFEELAVEFMMVKLALNIEPDLKGYSHIQTNPRWSYDTKKTIRNADRKSPRPTWRLGSQISKQPAIKENDAHGHCLRHRVDLQTFGP